MLTLSLSVDITHQNVLLFASISQKYLHHSDVAVFIASATCSKVIFHADTSSLSSDIVFPVFSAIACNGLNQLFTNCNRSCHVSFHAALTCQKTNARLWNLSLLPPDISHNILIELITSSWATQNHNIVLVADASSAVSKGVFAASFCISENNFLPLSADQVSTFSSVLSSCILLALLTAIVPTEATARNQAVHAAAIFWKDLALSSANLETDCDIDAVFCVIILLAFDISLAIWDDILPALTFKSTNKVHMDDMGYFLPSKYFCKSASVHMFFLFLSSINFFGSSSQGIYDSNMLYWSNVSSHI